MNQPTPAFRRYISPAFVQALHDLVGSPQGQWWRDVLAHTDLKLAVRNDSFDVYHCGASIFRIVLQDDRVVPRTHFKYLVRQRQGHALIAADGKTFVHEAGKALWSAYEGRITLNEMIAAAKPLAGPEKTGLHPLIMYPRVIDLEVAFRSAADGGTVPILPNDVDADSAEAPDSAISAATEEAKLRQDRLDAATLEDRGGELWIVFHEAKHFTNPELRASPSRSPPVTEQIARYRRSIEHYASDIKTSYRDVSRALGDLRDMRAKADPTGASQAAHWDPLIQRAADGETLHVDIEPRLIVFGFDDDQKKGSTWTHHRERLQEANLSVHAVGKPSRKGGAAAFARRAT